jgi:hypothetical protein
MKTMLSLWRHHYLRMFSMFLIAVVLIAGIVSCGGGGGGGVKPLDHFKGYGIDVVNIPYVNETVEVGDQFGNWTATVGWGASFANPVEKTYNGVTEGILDEVCHFMGFGLEGIEPKWWRVTVDNQFGVQNLTVYGPTALSVPTGKNSLGEPEGYNCLLNYEVIDPSPIEVVVNLTDQFGTEQNVLVTQAKGFANPAWMKYNGELMEIVNEDDHAVGYWTLSNSTSMEQNEVVVSNVFGNWTVNVTEQKEGVLSVPSEKISWVPIEPPLDHFRCYNFYGEMPNPGAVVELEDQFGTFNATVGLGTTFCNPVEKMVNEIAAWELVPISHPDYHFVVYLLEGVEPIGEWVVEVKNQFGTQNWTVSGPGALAVPTQKQPHGEPEGLDYFLLYGINESPPMDVIVDLTDEFGGGDNNFEMVEPFAIMFGNPVQITYGGNVTNNIVNPADHLVFYWMRDADAIPEVHTVNISNPFGQWILDVFQGNETLLAVPSEKISHAP